MPKFTTKDEDDYAKACAEAAFEEARADYLVALDVRADATAALDASNDAMVAAARAVNRLTRRVR